MIHARRSRCYVGEHSPRQAASAPHWRSTESSPSSLVPTPPPPTKVCPSTELDRDACRERSADQGPTSLSRERPLQLENTPEIDKDPLPDRPKGSLTAAFLALCNQLKASPTTPNPAIKHGGR